MKQLLIAATAASFAAAFAAVAAQAQDTAFERAVMAVCGAGDISEVSETDMERCADLARHPLRVNMDSRQRLEEVLDTWRAASVVDWRSRSGDICSWTELASVDGFNAELVAALKPFLSLETASSNAASSGRGRGRAETLLRASLKADEGEDAICSYALKCRYTLQGRGSVAFALKRLSGSDSPDALGFSAEIRSRRLPARLVIGDFHARFGQGLAVWSGLSMSGLGTVEAFRKRAAGVRSAWTLSPQYAMRGAALQWDLSRSGSLSALLTKDGMTAFNFRLTGRRSVVGTTAYLTLAPEDNGVREGMVALDGRWMLRGWLRRCELYGECGYDLASGRCAATGGLIWTPAYRRRIALMLRSYPDGVAGSFGSPPRSSSKYGDETGVAAGFAVLSAGGLALGGTLDWAVHPVAGSSQLKSVTDVSLPLASWLTLKPRLTWRLRPQDDSARRMDARLDADVASGVWSGRLRGELVRCEGLSRLYYAEAGYAHGRTKAHVRVTLFSVDRWNDRIYCYERDVPGMFSVPAYYGRGAALHALCSLSALRGQIHLRGSYMHYSVGTLKAGVRTDKPDRVEVRLQYNASF